MGPLHGKRIVELGGIGPVPFAGMMLADLGAEVIKIDRTTGSVIGDWPHPKFDTLGRGRRSIAVNLKSAGGIEIAKKLIEGADALIEGFRPGVAERLGLGPEDCAAVNPRLVYGRMTGWGQDGPLADAVGHDINYVALSGALHSIGVAGGPPAVPLNLIGDFGGGAMYLVVGVLAALLEAAGSGKGQVVDAAMVDGASSLMAAIYGVHSVGAWSEQRGTNLLDGGAPFYGVYETSDGRYVSIGSIEPQFYAELLRLTGLDQDPDLPGQHEAERWGELRARLSATFLSKTRDEWCAIMEGSDVCFAPVLTMGEATEHAHIRARGSLVKREDVAQPAPAPRFSRTPTPLPPMAVAAGTHTRDLLVELGYDEAAIRAYLEDGTVLES